MRLARLKLTTIGPIIISSILLIIFGIIIVFIVQVGSRNIKQAIRMMSIPISSTSAQLLSSPLAERNEEEMNRILAEYVDGTTTTYAVIYDDNGNIISQIENGFTLDAQVGKALSDMAISQVAIVDQEAGDFLLLAAPIMSDDEEIIGVVEFAINQKAARSTLGTAQITIILIIVGALIGSTGLFFFIIRAASMPLVNLSRAALRIGGGDLSVPVQIQGAQEIATLGESLEKMRIELEKNVTYLEKRVQERTIDLETARQSAEDRAQELQTIGEVTNIIAREQRLDILLPLITQAISDKFGFYHTGLFLLDNARRYAVLQAANSEGGKRMLAREHKLEVGLTGIVGNVAQTGKPRIAMDVGEDAVYFDNPDLPQTRSEMALPLIIRNETIGVLDVQSIEAGIFKESDVSILSILADQVAVAIENARLAGQKQQALEEIDALYRQYLSQQWLSFAGQAKNLGYHQSNIGGKTITQVMETKEIRKALEDGKTIINHAQNENAEATLTAPVQLRGQTIGVLNIKAPVKGHKWTDDEINMVQAVSERLALALENARLITVAQRRAETERAISDMTAKIGSSINLQNILQTAVDELGRVLPQSDIVIQFQGKEDE